MSEQKCDCPPPGAPLWLATFADLMSLLMCFFVLLLSFSEMDVLKFKQISGSMKYAFGVQNIVRADDIPKGTSVIAQEFRPGKPEPTPIEIINQQTTEMTEPVLDFKKGNDESAGGTQMQEGEKQSANASQVTQDVESQSESQASSDNVDQQLKKIAEKLKKEVIDGAMELEFLGQQLIIRIKEQGSFAAGSGFLQPQFRPVIRQIGHIIKEVPGRITITGFTDDRHISNEIYRSNWELSATRAVSVAQELFMVPNMPQERTKIVGMAFNKPLAKNITAVNRAKNRRVEIRIEQGEPKESELISAQKLLE